MIKYILKCNSEHEFESWFSNSKEFEKLKTKKLIECIYCKSQMIEKSIMSPRVSKLRLKNIKNDRINKKELLQVKKDLIKIRKFIEKNFEYVGDKLAQKIKDIHYSKKKKLQYLWNHNLGRKRRIKGRRNRTIQHSLD